MIIGQLIREKRNALGLTLDVLASRVGCSKPYLSTIETGKVKNPPSDSLLEMLESILQFEKGYLLEIAYLHRLPAEIRSQLEYSRQENHQIKDILKRAVRQNMPAHDIRDLLQKSNIAIEAGEDQNNRSGLIPIINRVQAGYPVDYSDLDYPAGIADDYVRCPEVNDPNAFAVRVFGDSMEPRFYQGDVVVFSPSLEVRNGDDCFVRFADPHETTFKRVFFEEDDILRLQPRNEKYSPIMIPSNRVDGIYRAVVKYQVL